MPNDHNRLVVLGLGSLSLDLATALAATGSLPHLTRLLRENACAIEAESPVVPQVNRASLLTAAGPERHGIYGATFMDPALYTPMQTAVDALSLPTFPSRLAAVQKKVVCLGRIFPADAPESDTASGLDALGQRLRPLLAERRQGLDSVGNDWDMLFVELPGTDAILRCYYAAATNAADPAHGAVLGLLADWDQTLGAVLDRYAALPSPKRLLAVADCGLTGLVAEVDCNAWLASQGLLATAQREDGSLRILPHKTAAMALDGGRICINIKENFSRGVFHEHVAEKLAGELRDDLIGLADQGRPVFSAILLGRELGDGELAGQAPDLVCLPQPGFWLTARLDRPAIFGRFEATGCPTPQGALFCDSEGARPARMRDVGALILRVFDLPTSDARP